jgi:hypothetical protein
VRFLAGLAAASHGWNLAAIVKRRPRCPGLPEETPANGRQLATEWLSQIRAAVDRNGTRHATFALVMTRRKRSS